MATPQLTVAWFSFFPVEWLSDAPDEVHSLPRMHPASWQRVLLGELENRPGLKLHILVVRKQFKRDLTFERNGVTFHLIKVPGGCRAPSFYWLDTIFIKRRLAQIRPDVVHAWGTEQGAALVASRLKYPYVATVQGLFAWCNERVRLNRHERFAMCLEKWSLPRAPLVTTEAAFAVQYLKQRWPKLNVLQIEHAPDWIFHRLERRPQTEPRRFIFVGPFSRHKGADLLAGALDRLKDELLFELVVIGSPNPELLGEIKRHTSAGFWDRVQFRQNLSPAEVAGEMARATMMIFPTRADTSPNSVKEAVVAGLPVVASAVGGIVDYVFPGRNGILFTSGNEEALVRAVREACRHPQFGRGEVEPAARAQVQDYLSPKRMGQRFFETYQLAKEQLRD